MWLCLEGLRYLQKLRIAWIQCQAKHIVYDLGRSFCRKRYGVECLALQNDVVGCKNPFGAAERTCLSKEADSSPVVMQCSILQRKKKF